MIADILIKLAEFEAEEDQQYSPRPSMAGPSRCLRKMYYHSIESPKRSLPGRFFLTMDDSSWHEELTADWIRKSTYKLHSAGMHVNIPMIGMEWMKERVCRVPVGGKECGHVIPSGCLGAHIDGMLQEPMMEEWLYEHKALNHFTYQSLWEEDHYPIDYFTQCCLYARGLDKYYPLKGILLLIKNKNTAQYTEFMLNYDFETDSAVVTRKLTSSGDIEDIHFKMENIAAGASERFNIVEHARRHKLPPERKYALGDWQCDYCQWNGVCWDGYEKEFMELKVGTVLPEDVAISLNYMTEMKNERKRIEKEEESIKKDLLAMMELLDTREGRAGEYLLRRTLNKRMVADTKLIPEATQKICMKEIMYEKFTYTKPKGKPNAESH